MSLLTESANLTLEHLQTVKASFPEMNDAHLFNECFGFCIAELARATTC